MLQLNDSVHFISGREAHSRTSSERSGWRRGERLTHELARSVRDGGGERGSLTNELGAFGMEEGREVHSRTSSERSGWRREGEKGFEGY